MNRRFTAAAISMAMSATLVASAGTAQAENDGDGRPAVTTSGPAKQVTEAPDIASAQLAAKLSGQRVEALSERTADAGTWANPDGTLTTESYSGPVRVKEDGRWKPLDTTLVDTGAQLEPRTAVADVALSDGGSGDFASVSRGSRTFGLDWGKALPAPRLDGDTAVYASVVPQGDLHVTALPHGFSESLILKERPTEPVELRLPVTLEGMKLEKTPQRHLRLEDGSGNLVASAPAPRMWGTGTDPVSGDPLRHAEIATAVEEGPEGTVLVLRPSAAFLADPSVTYPVTIDPTTTLAASTDTWVATNYPDSQRGSTELKAGTYDAGTTKARSYVKFDIAKFAGKKVLSAELRLHSYWSASCSATGSGVEARRITGTWDPSSVTWGAQPATTATGAAVSKAAYGFSSACPANFMRWDVDGIAQAWADGQPNHGFQIKAVDEQDSFSWRRFRSANFVDGAQGPTEPALSVTYNTRPGAASAVNPAAGAVTADTTPTLQGKASDADGNTVRLTFEVWNADGTTRVANGTSPFVASGATAAWTAPALASGSHKWRIAVYDGTEWNGTWSAWRALTIDPAVPASPTVSSAEYPSDGLWYGDSGRAGTFRIADGTGKAVSAEYAFDGGTPAVTALTSGAANVSWTPTARGVHTLRARVRNAAGTWSDWREHSFRVGVITGSLTTPFINEIAEAHFDALLHPVDDTTEEVEEFPEETVVEEDDTPPGYSAEEDAEVEETEDSAGADAIAQLPDAANSSLVGTSPDGATQTLVDLPAAVASPAELSETGLVIYPNTQPDADTIAVRNSTSAVEVFHLLRGPTAPQSFRYSANIQPGQEITAVSENTLMISDAQGDATAFISAPLAMDAKGRTVPVSLSLSGSDIIVSLAPAPGQTVAFPVLLDPGAGYGDLTPAERRYCSTNPYDCNKARKDADKAFGEAAKRYPKSSLFQGTGDAFRHCYWNARMEINIDHDTAYEVATRHESESRGVDKEMDLRNNKIGRKIGRDYRGKSKSNHKARDKCISYTKNGKLWTIKNKKLVKSNA
ncbi:DNRLRE domain-containing protein [Streptomyces microflavus]|uniref:DNRLRE domain-containing protein n=1 Tax=Streptomyces microflavus TaxID=1919 RepID=UPI0033FE097C